MPHLMNGDWVNTSNPLEVTVPGDVIPATDTTFTGQVVVATAGTPVQGPSKVGKRGFLVTPLSTNVGYSWVFPFGLAKTSGYPVTPGTSIVLNVANLNQVGFDVDTSGNAVCWLEL